MQIILIRHGETTWNDEGRIQGWTDVPLNEKGKEQAARLAQRLAGLPITGLYSSSSQRAQQTAEVIGRRLGLEVVPDERLREHGLGDLEGLTIEDVKARYPDVYRRWREDAHWVPLPGEEGLAFFRQRVASAMQEIIAGHHDHDTVAVVAHGGTISAFLADLLDLDTSKRFPFWFDNASLSVVEIGGPRPRISLLNDTCHLVNGE